MSPLVATQQNIMAGLAYYHDSFLQKPQKLYYEGKYLTTVTQDSGFLPPKFNGAISNPYLYIFVYLAQTLFYCYIIYKYDLKRSKLEEEKLNDLDDDLADQEPEVLEEQERLQNPNCEDLVKVVELSKQYPNGFTAIKNNNFGVRKGEIFGLLGPNGAGKSTSFNILTSLIPKSAGSVKLKNIEVDQGIMDIY